MLSRLKSIIASTVLIISSVVNIYAGNCCKEGCKCCKGSSNTSSNNGGKDGGPNITTKNITLGSDKTLDLDGTKLTAETTLNAKTAGIVSSNFYDEKGAKSFTIWENTDKNVFDECKQKNIKVNFTGGGDTHILALVHIKYGKDNHKYYYVYCSDGNSDDYSNTIFIGLLGIEEVIILNNGSNLTKVYLMFNNCTNLTNLNLSNFNTQNVTDMGCMFYECSSLTSLDLSSFNTQNVTDISYMFYGCRRLQSLDLSKFNTQKVNNMQAMFQACYLLDDIKLSSFNTQNVTDMSFMFNECSSLEKLDLSKFNTQNVNDIDYMFGNCNEKLKIKVGTDTTTKTGLIEQAQEDGYKVYNNGVCSKI